MTFAMELAAATHHSSPKGGWPGATHDALRGQTTASSGVLKEPEPPNVVDRVQRHILEQTVVSAPGLQILDAPVPQMVDQLLSLLTALDSFVPEQVIEVPKISTPSRCPHTVLSVPQTAEQLVEVPTIISYSREVRIFERLWSRPFSLLVRNAFLSGLWSRPWTFQFMVVVRLLSEVLKTVTRLSRDRVQQLVVQVRVAGEGSLDAGLCGFIESDFARAAYAFVEDVPFFLEGSCRLGDHVTFAVGRGADGLEAFDLEVVGGCEGLGIPSLHPGCHFLPGMRPRSSHVPGWLLFLQFALCSLWLSAGPRCSASWPVWTRRTSRAVFPGSGMYKAGIAGDNAPRAVLASLVGRLIMLGIMAGMVQMGRFARIGRGM